MLSRHTVHLETKLVPEPYRGPRQLSHRLIRTRVSIRLDQATTQLGDLPIDWCVTVDDPPDIDEVHPSVFEMSWMIFLCEVIRDMTQYSWMLRGMFDTSTHFSAVKSSTCSGSARSFHGRTYCEEQSKDLWGINRRDPRQETVELLNHELRENRDGFQIKRVYITRHA